MGGRGASSGTSKHGNSYGSQYNTIHSVGNIKFVKKNSRNSEPIMETMTQGRIYAVVGGSEVISVVYFDKDNKRNKQIDIDKPHNGVQPHTHYGYFHNENGSPKGASKPTTKEKRLVDMVIKEWENFNNGK